MRRETLTYLASLALIAVVAAALFLTAIRMAESQHDIERTTGLGDHQRMLAQLITSDALQLEAAKTPDEQAQAALRLRDAVTELATIHTQLRDGSKADGIVPPSSPGLRAIYFTAPYDLDTQINHFLDLGTLLLFKSEHAANQGSGPHLAELVALADGPLRVALDAASLQRHGDEDRAALKLRQSLLVMLAIMVAVLASLALFVFRPLFSRLARHQHDLIEVSQTDPLTGCLNRRSLLDAAARDFSRARRNRSPYSVLLLDIDHFKAINDTHGHAVGDEVIRSLVNLVHTSLRAEDLLGRIGGEEFVVFMADTDGTKAALVAEKLRTRIAGAPIIVNALSLQVTASIGIAEMRPSDDSPFTMIERADARMYDAKKSGRNQVAGCAAAA
jgi:diguanylate cyclase (GGDEF)-like protein